MGKGGIQVCQGCLCWDGGTERREAAGSTPERHGVLEVRQPFPEADSPFVSASRGWGSTNHAWRTWYILHCKKEPLQSDGNRTYAPGKGPTSQGGMDE